MPNIKRINLNVEARLHEAFKAATAARGRKMTDVLLEFINRYVNENTLGLESSSTGVRPKKR